MRGKRLTVLESAQPYEREAARGLQYFSGVPDENIVGKPYRHMAADMQARRADQWRCASLLHVLLHPAWVWWCFALDKGR